MQAPRRHAQRIAEVADDSGQKPIMPAGVQLSYHSDAPDNQVCHSANKAASRKPMPHRARDRQAVYRAVDHLPADLEDEEE